MKIVNKIKIIHKAYRKRLFVTTLLLLICVVSFYMSDYTWNNYIENEYSIQHEYNAYGEDPYDINKITFSISSGWQERISMLEGLSSIPEIKAYGTMTKQSTNDLIENESINIIICNIELTSMCNIGKTEQDINDLYEQWGELEPVLLGSSFKDQVEIGTQFYILDYACVVAGFIDQDSQWLVNQTQTIDFYNLEDSGVLLTQNFQQYNFDKAINYASPIYYITDYNKKSDVDQQINDYQQTNGINAGITNEGEALKESLEENTLHSDKTFLAAVLLYIIAIVSVSAVTIIECMINKKDYAIFMICGIKRRTVHEIILMKNMFITLLAGLLAWVYFQYEIFGSLLPISINFNSKYDYIPAKMSHCVYVPLILIMEALIMVVLSCVVPMIYLGKENLVNMLKK